MRVSSVRASSDGGWLVGRRVGGNGLIRPEVHFYLFYLVPSALSLSSLIHFLLSFSILLHASSFLVRSSSSFLGIPSLFDVQPPSTRGGKHSQSFSPFCDSISADIAAVSLDSSIRSDEDAAREIYSLAMEKERGRERQKETEGIGGIESENWYVWYEEEKKGGS